jgi:hypothetical protein
MLDMRRYILEKFSSTALHNHISNEGGRSLFFLKVFWNLAQKCL